MDEEEKQQPREEAEKPGYEPRPAWQLWAARIGLVLFILLVIGQIVQMLRGFR